MSLENYIRPEKDLPRLFWDCWDLGSRNADDDDDDDDDDIAAGWWVGTFFHILEMSSSQFTHIFQRVRSTTNQVGIE